MMNFILKQSLCCNTCSFTAKSTRRQVSRYMSSWNQGHDGMRERPVWSDEWKKIGLGAQLVDSPRFPPNLFFVQMGFGVDQHGESHDATKAAVRAVRNAIEFNSIPGVISRLPGGRKEMLIHVRLGVPRMISSSNNSSELKEELRNVDVWEVAKVFPYGKLLPIDIEMGGLSFPTGRVVEELGDADDIGICVAACVTLGYEDDSNGNNSSYGSRDEGKTLHVTYNTKDGY